MLAAPKPKSKPKELPRPKPTGKPIQDLWFHAQWELSRSETPQLVMIMGCELKNVGRTRARTTVNDIQKVIDTRSGVHDRGDARTGDFEDDEEDEVELSLVMEAPPSPRIDMSARAVGYDTMAMGIGRAARGSSPPLALLTDTSSALPSSLPPTTHLVKSKSATTGLKRKKSRRATPPAPPRLGTFEERSIARGQLIRKMFFKAQMQLGEGKQPSVLLRFGGGYRIANLKKYSSRYKHMAKRKSYVEDYLATDWTVARAPVRTHIDTDIDDEVSVVSRSASDLKKFAAAD